MDETAVTEIISKYTLSSFRISNQKLVSSLECMLNYDPTSAIESIVKITREESTGFFSSKTIKLKDELLLYPRVKLIFELSPGNLGAHPDRCAYLNLNAAIHTLNKWLNSDPQNQVIYNLINDDKRFYSKFNPNWIIVPYNMRMALSLSEELRELKELKKTRKKQ